MPSAYPPSVGGVEELTRHLALVLVAGGDEVEVWTGLPDDHGVETVEVSDGLVVRRFPMPLPASSLGAVSHAATAGWRTVRSLRRAVATFRPDVVHVQCFGPNGAYATALSRVCRVPLVVTLQGETMMDDSDIFETSQALRSALRVGLRAAAAVTACSAFTLRDAVVRFGLPEGRGRVIFNGVSLDPATEVVSPVDLPAPLGEAPYVLALGRVVDKKGFDLLLAGYAAMDPALRTADLVIGGSGPALERLEVQAEESGIGHRIHFVGRLTREQVAAAMAGATRVRHAEPSGAVRDRRPRGVAGRHRRRGHRPRGRCPSSSGTAWTDCWSTLRHGGRGRRTRPGPDRRRSAPDRWPRRAAPGWRRSPGPSGRREYRSRVRLRARSRQRDAGGVVSARRRRRCGWASTSCRSTRWRRPSSTSATGT